MDKPKLSRDDEPDRLITECQSVAWRAGQIHEWLLPILRSSAAARNAYAFKDRVKSADNIRSKVVGHRKDGDYHPSDVMDASGFRIVKLFNAEVPQALDELLALLETVLPAGPKQGRLLDRCVREIEFHTSRRHEDPLSIFAEVDAVVKKRGLELATSRTDRRSSYSSVHVLVECEVQDGKQTIKSCCEIQLRSVFEDAWGEISHRLRYAPKKAARGVIGPSSAEEAPAEFWLHLDALKSLTDGCAQYADLINRQIQHDTTTGDRREPVPLDKADKSVALFKDLPPAIRDKVRDAYAIRTKANAEKDSKQKAAGYRRAASAFDLVLADFPQSDARYLHLLEELAFCYMSSDNEELRTRAELIYRDVLKALPNRISALLRLGQLRRGATDYVEAKALMEKGLEVAESVKKPEDPVAHDYALWLLRRDLAYVLWRLTDRGLPADETAALLKRAVELSEAAIPIAPPGHPAVITLLNLLYYLTDLRKMVSSADLETLDERARPCLLKIRELIKDFEDLQDDVEILDTLARAEQAFGDKQEAIRAAKKVNLKFHERIESIRKEKPYTYASAFAQLTRDEQDMYLNAQHLLNDIES